MEKKAIAERLEMIGRLLELQGENPFKVRAYQNGARALETLEEDLGQLLDEGRLAGVAGIGKALVEKIETLYHDEELPLYQRLIEETPQGLLDMAEVPNLGPKKITQLRKELGIEDLSALKAACEDGRVAELKGFGKKTAEKILNGIEHLETYSQRHRWWDVQEIALPLLEALREQPAVERAEIAGSFRRKRETVGDLDFLVASDNPQPIMDWFVQRQEVAEVYAHGQTKSSVRFHSGLQADLRVVGAVHFPFALHYFTGSKDHNVRLRQLAIERGYSLSEWGLIDQEKKKQAADSGLTEPEAAQQRGEKMADEEALFQWYGLAWIAPELRENRGEIEAARENKLPRLLEAGDIRGVFHNHTTASDGSDTLEEMTAAAQALGFEYLGIADHSKASFQASGLDEERLRKQIDAIRQLNDSGKFTCYVFAGNEVDILRDGDLDFADDLLSELDYVVASVHNRMGQDGPAMTKRIIRALENEHVTMLGHLTGRLLLKREPYEVDVNKVIDAAAANGKIIELNANPWRLDMDWRHWRRAAEKGVLCAINPDAHDTEGLALYQAGVNVARKGWLSSADVFNTRPLAEVCAYLG